MDAEALTDIIERAGYEVTRYSGRAMYGAECPALIVEPAHELEAVAQITLQALEHVTEAEICKLFRRARALITWAWIS